MSLTIPSPAWMLLLAASLATGACSRSHASSTGGATIDAGVLAIVDRTPITETDIQLRLKGDGHGTEMKPEFRKNLVDGVIHDQLQSERAVELGLDKDPAYLESLRPMEAQLAAFKRKALSEALVRHEVTDRVSVSDEDARRYFDEHKKHLQSEVHVLQIMQRSEAAIQKAKAEIEEGKAFDVVAAEPFPAAAGASHPWDLGYLKWEQLPEAWQAVLDGMKKGDVSAVLRGPRSRFWIIQLVDQREQPSVTFESVKGALKDNLKRTRIEALQDKMDAELRSRAHVEYSPALQ